MGTSGAYTGSGGKPGKDLRQGVEDWLAQLASGDQGPTSSAGISDNDDRPNEPDDDADRLPADAVETQPDARPNRLPTEALLNVIALLRPRGAGGGHSDGPGGIASGGRPSVGTGRSGGRGGLRLPYWRRTRPGGTWPRLWRAERSWQPVGSCPAHC
jgi:hypothetical protein